MTHQEPKAPETDTEKVLSLSEALNPENSGNLESDLKSQIDDLKASLEKDKNNEDVRKELMRCQRDLLHVQDGTHPGPGWESVDIVDNKTGDPWAKFREYEQKLGRGKVRKVGVAYSHTGVSLLNTSTIFVKKS
ncbi:hypothetical protein ACFL14_00895 [Patescibacteria group bacterium]